MLDMSVWLVLKQKWGLFGQYALFLPSVGFHAQLSKTGCGYTHGKALLSAPLIRASV